jgi:hypothetical protein
VGTAVSVPVRSEPPKELILREWIDDDGFPCREIIVGTVECPTCGEDVEMTAESDAWEEYEDGRKVMIGYGPAMAEHCELLLAETDMHGTVSAFELEPERPDAEKDVSAPALEPPNPRQGRLF